jgi:hypothetical protein
VRQLENKNAHVSWVDTIPSSHEKSNAEASEHVYEAPVGSIGLSLPQHLVLLSATISLNLQINELTEKLVQVRKRATFGHWELDTVVSSRGKSKACVATFIERKTRHYLALRMPDRNAYRWRLPLVL